MNYKIVKGPSKYHVMYKKHWWSRWKYCRRPKGQAPNDNFAYVWQWDTERGAQAYINECLRENMNEVLPQADVIKSVCFYPWHDSEVSTLGGCTKCEKYEEK